MIKFHHLVLILISHLILRVSISGTQSPRGSRETAELPAQLFLTVIHRASASEMFVSLLFIKQSVKGRIQASPLSVSKANSQIQCKWMSCGRSNKSTWHFSLLGRNQLDSFAFSPVPNNTANISLLPDTIKMIITAKLIRFLLNNAVYMIE